MTRRPRRPLVYEEDRQFVIERFHGGENFHAIAEDFGIGPSTVWKILREAGAFPTKVATLDSFPDEFKHSHRACIACLHQNAHGTWDGFSMAIVMLMKAGYTEAAEVLLTKQKRVVNRSVRKIGIFRGIDTDGLAELMRHHEASA